MSLTFVVSVIILLLMAALGRFFINLPKNVWLLFLAQPLAMCSSSMVVFAGGLLASKIAPSQDLATLPLTSMILGTAAAVIPASLAMKRFGRRIGTILGLLLAVVGALLAMMAAIYSLFSVLIIGTVLMGASLAFVAQMRFAAIESVDDAENAPKAISVLMVGGIFAAILGPEVAVNAKFWLSSPYGFAGSFLGLAGLLMVAIIAIAMLDPIGVAETQEQDSSRSLGEIVKQPIFIIAVAAGAIGYSVMSYVMTATPLSMHEVEGHGLHDTKWVVQSHIVAMYLPSLFSAFLIRYIGIAKLMILGCLMYVGVILVALAGKHVMHYWWALVLLGVGWNFLFTSGTLLLPESYQSNERFKVQAVNDFSIFFVQAMGSLFAGIILFSQGWNMLISVIIPIILVMFAISIWYFLLLKKSSVAVTES